MPVSNALYAPIDLYCERLNANMAAEPFNVLSNLVFFITAYYLLQLRKNSGRKDGASLILISFVFATGVGSSLFHLFANGITLLMDVLPILCFVLCYVFIGTRRLLHINIISALSCVMLLLGAAFLTSKVPAEFLLNGSLVYVPCLLAVCLLAACCQAKKHTHEAKLLWTAAIVFALSLTLRTIDQTSCLIFTHGTHMGWHLLNGVVLYLLVKTILLKSPPTACKADEKV